MTRERSRTGGMWVALVLLGLAISGCRVAVTDCIDREEAEESGWQLRRAGFDASSERCGRGRMVTVPRWDGAGAQGAVSALGLPRRRLAVPKPEIGMWPSASDRARLARHEVGARAAAVVRGLPQVEDAWVELRAEGSGEVATATVVMREGSADWAQVERAVRGMEGLSGVARIERIGTTVPRLSAGVRWAKVGPFRVDAGQAGLLRWSFVSVLLLLSVFAGLLATAGRRGSR